MSYLMSIDLGTSSVKTMIMRVDGKITAIVSEKYDISIPKISYAEQDPIMWYHKAKETIKKAIYQSSVHADDIVAVSFSGQMHGLVCVDKRGIPVRPAIIWPDQRSQSVIQEIYQSLGVEFIKQQTQNKISTGFLLPSLLWLSKYEKSSYEETVKVMLPKDYLKYRLTGTIVTDYSDAAGSLAFDNINLCWAKDLIEKLGLDLSKFPECYPSKQVIGKISAIAAKETGLSIKTIVVNGGCDQCMQEIGNGVINDGIFSSNIGTGGQISTTVSKPIFDKYLRTNTFTHVIENRWNIMGACLTSGASLKWLSNNIIGINDFKEIDKHVAEIAPCSEGLIFLPYLAGERTPHLNPNAKSIFFGLTLKHNRFHLARAVMEGVTFSLLDCFKILINMGIECKKIISSGGGASSPLWLQMQADIFERDVYKSSVSEQSCLGAAITAGVGSEIYSSYSQACNALVKPSNKVYHPNKNNREKYRNQYEIFKQLYVVNKNLFNIIDK